MNINLNNFNLNNINLTQPENVREALVAEKNGMSLLNMLNIGDEFEGKILDININHITVQISEDAVIKGTLSESPSYNIGDEAVFTVKTNDDGHVVLKSRPLQNEPLSSENALFNRILHNAGLPVTEENIKLASDFMKYGLPVAGETITEYASFMKSHPDVSHTEAVILAKLNIPMTEDSIDALRDYNDFSEGISESIRELSGIFTDIASAAADEDVYNAGNLLRNFTDSFSKNVSVPEPVHEKIFSKLKEILKDSIPSPDNGSDYTPKELLKKISGLPEKGKISPGHYREAINSKEFKELVKDFIRQEFFIRPEDVNKENIKKLYVKILKDTDNVISKFSGNENTEVLAEAGKSIKNDASFLNHVNSFINYVQIPLKMAGKSTHGDLYVYKNNKKSVKKMDNALTALLHLDMTNLGPVDIFVSLNNRRITTDFKVSTDEILTYIESHMSELTERLSSLGYEVKAVVSSAGSTEYSFAETVFKEEFPPSDVKRFSFDIRA